MRPVEGLLLGILLVAAPLPASGHAVASDWPFEYHQPTAVRQVAWTTATLSQPRVGIAATRVGTQALFAGGQAAGGTLSNVVDIYDVTTGSWSSAALYRPRADVTAVTVGTQALFAGGRADDAPASDIVDVYDISTGQWTVNALPQVRTISSVTVMGASALFVGPTDVFASPYSPIAADAYDSTTGTWVTNLLSPSPGGAGVATAGGRVLLAGGNLGCGKPCVGRASGTIHLYATVAQRWRAATLSQPRWGIGTASLGNEALFAGGRYEIGDGRASQVSKVVDVYQSTTGRWSTATLSQARSDPSAATVGTKVIFAGGWRDGDNTSAEVDIHDAATGGWTAALLPTPRAAMLSVTVGTQALFAGGLTGNRAAAAAPSAAVDVYDAANGAWRTAKLSRAALDLDALVLAGMPARPVRPAAGRCRPAPARRRTPHTH